MYVGYNAKELSRIKELLKKGLKKKEDDTMSNIYVLLLNEIANGADADNVSNVVDSDDDYKTVAEATYIDCIKKLVKVKEKVRGMSLIDETDYLYLTLLFMAYKMNSSSDIPQEYADIDGSFLPSIIIHLVSLKRQDKRVSFMNYLFQKYEDQQAQKEIDDMQVH